MAHRNKIKRLTMCSRVYKYMHQDRIFYRETNRHFYSYGLNRNWKRFRTNKFKQHE